MIHILSWSSISSTLAADVPVVCHLPIQQVPATTITTSPHDVQNKTIHPRQLMTLLLALPWAHVYVMQVSCLGISKWEDFIFEIISDHNELNTRFGKK